MSNGIDWDRYDAPAPPPESAYPDAYSQAYPQPGNQPQNAGLRVPETPSKSWLVRRLESPAAKALWARRRHTIVSIFIAILLALSIAVFGFGYTLLGVIFVAIAYLYGGWRDGNPLVYKLLNRFL
ncbi:MAG: DUF2273 domain-containing protein [Peptococcus niger]|nr:DUF2273 domain-containing protein [Clostridiales bacterium]MDU2292704.1 DUF2273 domain-containing protein [Peptococcus niger]